MNDATHPITGVAKSGALAAYLSPVLEKRRIALDSSQRVALGRL